MGKVAFTVSARTAKLIGQENFATAEGAIVELVKNSYDADARNCIIIFKNHPENTTDKLLYIIDNGVGMTGQTIVDLWMKIGTDDKLQHYESEKGRIKTGAKGIGRFALDRLGVTTEMYTLSTISKKGSIWKVDWSAFDKEGMTIGDINADLEQDNKLDLKGILKEEFAEYPTIIQLIDDTNLESGTVLKIGLLKDIWDEAAIQKLFDNLEVLTPPQEQPEFDIYLFITNVPNEYGKVNAAYYDDFDYKVQALYNGDPEHQLEFTITRNELNVSDLETRYNEVFDSDLMKEFPYTLEVFKERTFKLNKSIYEFSGFSTNIDPALLQQIGKFEFIFYFLKVTLDEKLNSKFGKVYPYLDFSTSERRAWLKKFGGVKIFRDDFRVRPYGENGQDWLGLGDRQAKSPAGPGQRLGGYRIGPNQIAGTVKISRIENNSFNDKSGREGIIENDAFDLFKNILLELIGVFERDRNVIMYSLSQLAKRKFKDQEEKRKAQEEADRILREQEEAEAKAKGNGQKNDETDTKPSTEAPQHKSTQAEVTLARAAKIYEQELEEKNEEIHLLRSLASVGLIVSSFAHELRSLRSRLIPRTGFLITELNKYIKKSVLKGIEKEDDPFYMIQLIKEEDLKLKHWLDYSLSSLKRDKRTRTNINVGEYFHRFKSAWKIALTQRNVVIVLKGNKTNENEIRAFEVDLDTIFNNLLSNSLNALKDKKGKYKKEVTIDWKREEDAVVVTFSDNGIGLAPEYVNEPNRIFEFNESSRKDGKGNKIGTGMGLFIVKTVVADYNGANINIQRNPEGFSLRVHLPIRKNE